MSQQFDRSLAFGQLGEAYIAQWLRRICEYNVLPVYEKQMDTGKGPMLFCPEDKLIAPDLFVFKRVARVKGSLVKGRVRWVEAKTKSAFTWHRITQRWTTGIDLRHYEDYLKVSELSIWPVYILFLHLDGKAKDTPSGRVSPQGLFGNKIKYLAKNESHRSNNHGRSGMVYWAHSKLTQLATLDEVLHTTQATTT